MLVPDESPQPPGCDERIEMPGATTSGFRRREIGVGPAEEKSAIAGVVPDVVAPTVIASGALPGEPTEPVTELLEVVAGRDHRHHAGGRGAIERERDEVARRLDLGLAEREVDDVHAVGDRRLDRRRDLRRVAVQAEARPRSGS